MRIFERWNFWLVLKHEISDRVIIISWRILVYIRGFFEDYIFAWWHIWVSLIFLLPVILFNVNDKAVVWHTPCWAEGILPRVWHTPFMLEKFYKLVKTSAQILVCAHILTERNLQSQTTCGEISENAFRFLKCPMSFLQRVVPSQAMGRNQTYLTQAIVPVMPTALGIARHFWLSPESSLARLPAHCPRINFKSSQSTEYHQLSSFSS
jgi:hypothetical protein